MWLGHDSINVQVVRPLPNKRKLLQLGVELSTCVRIINYNIIDERETWKCLRHGSNGLALAAPWASPFSSRCTDGKSGR